MFVLYPHFQVTNLLKTLVVSCAMRVVGVGCQTRHPTVSRDKVRLFCQAINQLFSYTALPKFQLVLSLNLQTGIGKINSCFSFLPLIPLNISLLTPNCIGGKNKTILFY